MWVEREHVVRAMKDFTDAIHVRSRGRVDEFLRDEPEATREALVEACQKNGISVEIYVNALVAAPALAELEKQSLLTAVADAPDPGPYDAISRESPSGQPGDLTKPRTLP